MKRMTRRSALTLTAAGLIWPHRVAGQERVLRMIVPFPPGGAADYVARVIAKELGEGGFAKAVVENKSGANGVIGVDAISKAAPDGATIGFTTLGALVINPHLQALPYAPLTDLVPVTLAVVNTLTLVARKDLAVRSVSDVIALAKERPGKLTCGTSGAGSVLHVGLEQLKLKADINITHVPYKGEGPAVSDLVNGQVDLGILSLISVQSHVANGSVRVVGITGAKRTRALPDIATIAEQGVAGYEAEAWNGVFVPARTPAEIVAKLNADITGILKRPAVIENLQQRGSEVVASTADDFARTIKSDYEKYGAIVKAAGIKLE